MTTTAVGHRTLTFKARVIRKLHYGPFWADLGQRAARSATQAVLAYMGAHALHIVGFVGVPYEALAIVAALAALTSIAQTLLLTVAGLHNISYWPDVALRLAKTFLASFAAAALVGDTPAAALLSLTHALDVAGGATLLAVLTVFTIPGTSLPKPIQTAPASVGYGTVAFGP